MQEQHQCRANDDTSECFERFRTAKSEVFKWLEDEYRLILEGGGGNSMRTMQQRERREALDGDAEYKKFLENERRVNDKSYPNDGQVESHLEVSKVMLPPLYRDAVEQHAEQIQSKVEKLHNNGELSDNNDASWQMQLLQDVSNHYHPHRSHHTETDSNYNANIEGRLNTKMSLASEQNAIHEIGLKYQHLRENNELTTEKDHAAENLLSEKQLLDVIELPSNNNFQQPEKWASYDDDSSLPQLLHASDLKRSSMASQMQRRHFDDQTSHEKNDLWDEVDDKLSKTEQQGLQLVPLHRVKRRDVINQSNRKDVNENEMNEIGNNRFISVNADDDDDDNDDDENYGNFIENGEHGN